MCNVHMCVREGGVCKSEIETDREREYICLYIPFMYIIYTYVSLDIYLPYLYVCIRMYNFLLCFSVLVCKCNRYLNNLYALLN